MEYSNNLLAKIKEPFDRIFKDNLSLLLDKKGDIVHIFRREGFYPGDLIDNLEREANILKLFDFGRSASIHEASRTSGYYPIKKNFPDFEIADDFYTDIPLVLITLRQVEENLYLGVVKVADFLPSLPLSTSNFILFLDRQDRVRGFNRNFFNASDVRTDDPAKLLGRKASDFLAPSPVEIQKRFLRVPGAFPGTSWERVWGLLDQPKVKLAGQHRENSRDSGGKFRFENSSETGDYLFLPMAVNSAEDDLRFTVRVRKIRGFGPQLVIGASKNGSREPDFDGYMITEAFGVQGYFLKKKGQIISWSEQEAVDGELIYSFAKIGRGLFFLVNGQRAMAYYDAQFLHHRAAGLAIGVRPDSSFDIEDITVERRSTIDKEKPFTDQDIIVKMKSLPDRYFSLAACPNRYLGSRRPDITCYFLNDITHFEEKAALYRRQYREERKRGKKLESLLGEYEQKQGAFVGVSRDIEAIRSKAGIIASSTAPVLIQGPTGTGKEVLARFIHDSSPRRKKPFVKVDCSSLPESLLQSELFGHEKGAFTGALESRVGRFEQADTGTLFLDEIGNLSASIQKKLLGVLQDYTITRLGGNKAVRLDIRLIAASNIPLDALVKNGSFREDLYYRINTILLALSPLSERPEDIPPLCDHFIAAFNAGGEKKVEGLTAGAYKKLYKYSWPGNVRELRSVIQRAQIFCEGGRISEDLIELPKEADSGRPDASVKPSYHLKGMTKEKFAALVRKHEGVISGVARELGISRKACYDNFAKYGLDIAGFRPH